MVAQNYFLLRYMKAREEELYKKERLFSPVNKKFKNILLIQNKKIRGISKKDSLNMINQLHKTLYSFKNILNIEDRENNYDQDEPNSLEINKLDRDNKTMEHLQYTFVKKE